MGAEQSLVGGDGERKKKYEALKAEKRNNYEAYKAVRKMLEKQGKDFENQVFLDLPDARVLKRLGIFEDCDIGRFDDTECKNSIKNIVINAHGKLVSKENQGITITVPENIVVLFMGELGRVTWSIHGTNITKDICNKELVPNQIGLPCSTIPDVSLIAEYNKGKDYSTGIYDCDLNINDIINQFEGFEHYLIPTEKEIIKNMKPKVKEMLQEATKKREKIINSVTLKEILPEISKKIPKDKYGFVYVFSCLGGVCNKWSTQEEIEVYTKPTGLSSVRGYTVKKIPARVVVSPSSLYGPTWNPVFTNDKKIILARNMIGNSYINFNDKDFIAEFVANAFDFDQNWRNHLPDINSDFIQENKNKLRKSAYVNHFQFIDLLHEGDFELQKARQAEEKRKKLEEAVQEAERQALEKIKRAWNMQFEDETNFLLPRDKYINYSKKRNLSEKIIDLISDFKDNKEIIENIDELFVNPENKIINLIKDNNLEGLKSLLFQYMKYAVDGDEDFDIYYQDIYDDYDESDKDSEHVKEGLKILEVHDIYAYTVLSGELARDDNYYIKNKDEMKYLLDIKPYIDYVNSDEYEHPKIDYRINSYVRPTKDYVIEQMKKIENLIDEEYFDTIDEIEFENLIDNFEGNEEYFDANDEIAIQQGGQTGQAGQAGQAGQGGQGGQYGGMWQRGGFFMTCS